MARLVNVDLELPFEGLPIGLQGWFTVALVVVSVMFLWTLVLFVRGGRAGKHLPDPDAALADDFLWVFLVPALNEEVTIRDSVSRLLAIDAAQRMIVVIDDGSDDATGQILESIDSPDLFVLRREAPYARTGKAAALNDAYEALDGILAVRAPDVDRERVIVAVVDADGRLAADALPFVAPHFAHAEVGGLQVLVRIYNRQHVLTWLQDVEFSVYGYLYQLGRTRWGTAGLGGNAQFTRLVALDAVADETGPWRDKLTEDQDLGLRMLEAGWKCTQDTRAHVDQQGLSSLRRLLRQRTRWAQGNLQAIAHLKQMGKVPRISVGARLDLTAYLLMPIIQGFVGITFLAAILLWAFGVVPFWGGQGWAQIAFFWALGFAGVILGGVARGRSRGWRGCLWGIVVGQVYAMYTWLLWPALFRATWRQIRRRADWAKTDREATPEPELVVTPRAA